VITSPIRPRTQRQESGIAAGGRLAHPRNALRRFTFVRHHDTPMASFRPALTEIPQRNQPHWDRPVNSGPRPCLFDVGFPLSGSRDRTSTSDLNVRARHTAATPRATRSAPRRRSLSPPTSPQNSVAPSNNSNDHVNDSPPDNRSPLRPTPSKTTALDSLRGPPDNGVQLHADRPSMPSARHWAAAGRRVPRLAQARPMRPQRRGRDPDPRTRRREGPRPGDRSREDRATRLLQDDVRL
jgi:hypothetical protein